MCGIAGLWHEQSAEWLNLNASSMADAIAHRGPDDCGIWIEPQSNIAFSHRRLSILDLSSEGHQPKSSRTNRFTIVFNGEIYNYIELRSILLARGHEFQSNGDTEVMLAAFEEWGIENSSTRFNGMFAFAVWDTKERRLWLCRDRFGKKPLYYGWNGGAFLFGSELKALTVVEGTNFEINRDSLALQLRYSYVPTPYSIYKGIYKLTQGTYLSLSLDQLKTPPSIFSAHPEVSSLSPRRYYWAKTAIERAKSKPFLSNENEALEKFDLLLSDAVKIRMISDVPLGAFLSGGIDSSLIVALMQKTSHTPVKTFTIGFKEGGFDEAAYARQVAQHLGTEHTELYLSSDEALNIIPNLPQMFDEPFSDSSQIPTYLVSQLARKHVSVALSGDGGDELFGGYQRYHQLLTVWNKISKYSPQTRAFAGSMLNKIPEWIYELAFKITAPFVGASLKTRNRGYKFKKLLEYIGESSPEELYRLLISHWDKPGEVVTGTREPRCATVSRDDWAQGLTLLETMMQIDLISYFPDDIMVKVDRASMAASLESRVPLIDYRVVEFVWSLPLSLRCQEHTTKWLMRKLLSRYLPTQLFERPKMGFGVPIDSWLRGPLKDWAESLLDEKLLSEQGYLNPKPIREKWTQHLSGRRNWHYHLWDVLMFQAWLANRAQ